VFILRFLSDTQWWKLEEAYEQERQLRIEMSKRKNVLAVMFNDTFDHTYNKSIDSMLQTKDATSESTLSVNPISADHDYGQRPSSFVPPSPTTATAQKDAKNELKNS